MKIIIGLGNPGSEYAKTRHNVGFEVLDQCAKDLNLSFRSTRGFKALFAVGVVEKRPVLMLKPKTFMNQSGQVVLALEKAALIGFENLLVVCDDIALPLGELRLRFKGSSGGHNGLKSMQRALQSPLFARLRIGIGQPPNGERLEDFVLARFSSQESDAIQPLVEQAARACLKWTHFDKDQLLNEVNSVHLKSD